MKQFYHFIFAVFLLSIPLWVLGYIFDATKIIPIKLPISALQFICILIAAIVVTRRNGHSILSLLKRGGDFKKLKNSKWKYGIFLLMPLTVFTSYYITRFSMVELPTTLTPFWNLPIFLLVYSISAYCEQIGWTAIATDELLKRFSVLTTGILVGFVWAVLHIIPYTQTHNSANWILWQCLYTIIFRILITKIYTLTNKSVFATIALHTTYNISFSMLPYYGSSYNPFSMTIVIFAATITILALYRNNSKSD